MLGWREEVEDMGRSLWARVGRIIVPAASMQGTAGSRWHSASEYEESVLIKDTYRAWV